METLLVINDNNKHSNKTRGSLSATATTTRTKVALAVVVAADGSGGRMMHRNDVVPRVTVTHPGDSIGGEGTSHDRLEE